MPTSPTPPLEASLARIAAALASLALAADAWLELEIERFDPDIGRTLQDHTVSLHAWRDRFAD